MAKRNPTDVDRGDDSVIDRLSKVLNTMGAFSLAVGDVVEAARLTRDWAVATRERAANAEARNATLDKTIQSLIAKQIALEKENTALKEQAEKLQ